MLTNGMDEIKLGPASMEIFNELEDISLHDIDVILKSYE